MNKVKCSHCGNEIDADDIICMNCGCPNLDTGYNEDAIKEEIEKVKSTTKEETEEPQVEETPEVKEEDTKEETESDEKVEETPEVEDVSEEKSTEEETEVEEEESNQEDNNINDADIVNIDDEEEKEEKKEKKKRTVKRKKKEEVEEEKPKRRGRPKKTEEEKKKEVEINIDEPLVLTDEIKKISEILEKESKQKKSVSIDELLGTDSDEDDIVEEEITNPDPETLSSQIEMVEETEEEPKVEETINTEEVKEETTESNKEDDISKILNSTTDPSNTETHIDEEKEEEQKEEVVEEPKEEETISESVEENQEVDTPSEEIKEETDAEDTKTEEVVEETKEENNIEKEEVKEVTEEKTEESGVIETNGEEEKKDSASLLMEERFLSDVLPADIINEACELLLKSEKREDVQNEIISKYNLKEEDANNYIEIAIKMAKTKLEKMYLVEDKETDQEKLNNITYINSAREAYKTTKDTSEIAKLLEHEYIELDYDTALLIAEQIKKEYTKSLMMNICIYALIAAIIIIIIIGIAS